MAKCGRKPFEFTPNAVMPTRLIAAHLGVYVRTVEYALANALRKLRRDRKYISIVIDTIYAVAEDTGDIKAMSAECRKDFVAKWTGVK